jgi:hypothetical protein
MATIAEVLYEQLGSHKAVQGLIGRVEDAFFECKEWRPERSAQEQIAKAACGFTNADGGVIVVGLEARRNDDGIDMVMAERPVGDAEGIRSQIEEAISRKVEPGIKGVQSKTIPAAPGSLEGFIITYVPGSDGSPCRCTFSPKEFYVRIGPQTLPMPYFMIADRFGRRPQPRLIVDVQFHSLLEPGKVERAFTVTLSNHGRGIARFPAVRVKELNGMRTPPPTPESRVSMWPVWRVAPGWISIRGGADDVVYPNETISIVTLLQACNASSRFEPIVITTEVVADGMPAHPQTFSFDAAK